MASYNPRSRLQEISYCYQLKASFTSYKCRRQSLHIVITGLNNQFFTALPASSVDRCNNTINMKEKNNPATGLGTDPFL